MVVMEVDPVLAATPPSSGHERSHAPLTSARSSCTPPPPPVAIGQAQILSEVTMAHNHHKPWYGDYQEQGRSAPNGSEPDSDPFHHLPLAAHVGSSSSEDHLEACFRSSTYFSSASHGQSFHQNPSVLSEFYIIKW